jgi:arylsulfatase A-like enzyme
MKPNVIVLVSDTLRWDALGVNGGPGWFDIKTPELDSFAQQALRFDGARTSSFPTIPMRTDCFTGIFSHPRYGWQTLDPSLTTLPGIFRSNGYETQLLADTTHLLRSNFFRPFAHFDFLRGHEGDAPLSKADAPPRMIEDLNKTRVERNNTNRGPTIWDIHAQQNAWWRHEPDRLNSRLAEKTCRWLEDNWRDGPFFLWVDFFDVHEPWDPPEYLWRMYHPDYEGTPMEHPNYHTAEAYEPEELKNLRAHYAGEVTMVSKNLGRVLRMIDDMGLNENTIVAILSDHGIYVGERNRTGKSLIKPGVFDAFPHHIELSHLVWMMRIPGREPGVVKDLIQPPDLMPTILSLCGMEIPDQVEGHDLVPLMDGESIKPREVGISTWTMPTHHSEDVFYCRRPAVTDGEWTLVLQEPPDPRKPKLYHESEDPRQQVDLIDEETDVARDLHRRMLEWLADKNVPRDAIDRLSEVPGLS